MSGIASSGSRIFGLDIMRCCAILFVLLSHGRVYFEKNLFPDIKVLFAFGMMGVTLFFVLSGFLIGGILLRTFDEKCDFNSLKVFWLRRWFRTLPNYYLFFVISLIIALIYKKNVINSSIWQNFFFLQNFAWSKEKFYSISWSLAIEEWFYFLIPVCIFVFAKIFNFTIKVSVILTILIFIIEPIIARYYFYKVNNYGLWDIRFMTVARLDSLMIGVLFAFIKFYYPLVFNRIKLLWMPGLIITIISFLFLFLTQYGYSFHKSGIFIISFLTLHAVGLALFLPLCDSIKQIKRTLLGSSIVNISLWSYSLYLFHIVVMFFIFQITPLKTINNIWIAGFLFISFFTISILGSALIYNYFEKPAMKLREKFS